MEVSVLTPTQKYAAAALFAFALHQSQLRQARDSNPLASLDDEPIGEGMSVGGCVSVSEKPELWIHEKSSLLFPVLRFLGIDEKAWKGIQEMAWSSQARHRVGDFLKLISEESDGTSSKTNDKELALTKAVEATVLSMETSPVAPEDENERQHEYEHECREKLENATSMNKKIDASTANPESNQFTSFEMSYAGKMINEVGSEEPKDKGKSMSHQRKIAVLYELLEACIADKPKIDGRSSPSQQGYDSRLRVALRLMAMWLGVEWVQMEAMEIMVAYSLMASVKLDGETEEETKSPQSPWDKWKRGGIIGAAALTGGTLMAVTAGLAAPAIGAGLGALAPTLGTLVPAIGAGGFAAAASATGSFAGSIAVAASFGAAGAGLSGYKMARRIGAIEEFEFKAIGENHNQGLLAVGIFVSGLAFQMEDFVRPWEGQSNNTERYALQWESEHLIALSTAVRDWLTSTIAMELLKDGAMLTVLRTLLAALALPASLLTATNFIDSQWAVALDRSDQAGKLLADVLLKGLQGNRPVTLIGFSLGARVIFKCLLSLAEVEESHAAGLVERVVLFGAPISSGDENWESARKMVAGRFVNAYSSNDWTLGIAFRASLFSVGLAGLQPVDVPGVQNVDVTELVEGHSSYLWNTKKFITQLELDNCNSVFRPLAQFESDDNS